MKKEKHRDTYVEEDVANVEIDRQVSRLLNRMMLAHGSTAELLIEAVGVAAKYNFDRVAKTTKEIQQKLRKKPRNVNNNSGINRGLFIMIRILEPKIKVKKKI